jgi:hypothetical protein
MDLQALPFHIFGDHTTCSSYICENGSIILPQKYKKDESNKTTSKKNTELPRNFFQHDIWKEITTVSNRLADLSTSLMYNVNTNLAESFQAHVNKMAQGRRINNIMRGGYNRKVMEASFAYQYGTTWYTDLYEKIYMEPPLRLWIKARENYQHYQELKKEKIRPNKRRYAITGTTTGNPKFFSKNRKMEGNKDYGPNAQRDDMEPVELQRRMELELAKKSVNTEEEQWSLHLQTVGQFSNPSFVERRTGMITASIMGSIMSLRDSTSNVGILDKLIYSKDISQLPAIQWGHNNEINARHLYEKIYNIKVQDSGLFVSLEFGGLGASPDGLVQDGNELGVIEIKCPYNEKELLPSAVADRKTNAFLVKKTVGGEDVFTLKKSSDYYHQVIAQLHITNRSFCDFILWTQGPMEKDQINNEDFPLNPEGHLLRIRIKKDKETELEWIKMHHKLKKFYLLDYLPELVDSRIDGNMGYRQPEYRQMEINKLEENKRNKPPQTKDKDTIKPPKRASTTKDPKIPRKKAKLVSSDMDSSSQPVAMTSAQALQQWNSSNQQMDTE